MALETSFLALRAVKILRSDPDAGGHYDRIIFRTGVQNTVMSMGAPDPFTPMRSRPLRAHRPRLTSAMVLGLGAVSCRCALRPRRCGEVVEIDPASQPPRGRFRLHRCPARGAPRRCPDFPARCTAAHEVWSWTCFTATGTPDYLVTRVFSATSRLPGAGRRGGFQHLRDLEHPAATRTVATLRAELRTSRSTAETKAVQLNSFLVASAQPWPSRSA